MGDYTYVFMDESGDPGFKLDQGSSRFLGIAAVIFRNRDDMAYTEQILSGAKSNLGWKQIQEFRFHHASLDVRTSFCLALRECPFTVHSVVIDKRIIFPNAPLRHSPGCFYQYLIRLLLERNQQSINNAKVVLDDNSFREIETFLRKHLRSDKKMITSLKLIESSKSPLLQIADLAAGSVLRSYYPEKKRFDECRRLLVDRIASVIEVDERINAVHVRA